jgi:two-component system response regulator MprA
VLIVEDDVQLRRMYRMTLALAGYEVEDVPDGLEALRRIDQRPPDLVVLDLLLPALSGMAVRQEIAAHAHTRRIPIVLMTGPEFDVPDDAPCVLRKPISPEDLVRAVQTCLADGLPPLPV